MAQTLVEKIAQLYADRVRSGEEVRAGDMIRIRPRHVMTHDNTGAVMKKFASIGATEVFERRQMVFCLDHDIQNRSEENLAKYHAIEAFAREHGIAFHPAGSGIGHQIMVEEGYVIPGSLCVASDSHANLYGAVGALGTPIVRTDAAAIWATGTTWWEVPPIARVRFTGKLRQGATGKDVILSLIGTYNRDEVLNMAVEFSGPGVAGLPMDDRLTIANMTTEWGALVGIFPCDETTFAFYEGRARFFRERGDAHPRITEKLVEKFRRTALAPDPDAFFAKEIEFDLARVSPHVAGPNEVKTLVPIEAIEAERIAVKKAYVLSCVNARLADFAQAASVVRGKKVAEGVDFYIAAASASVQRGAERLGYWKALLEAGAKELPPGCGPCIGLGTGTLEAGEVGISATNRNFKGRMGSRDAFVYLASPAVVAASAVRGYICAPEPVRADGYVRSIREHEPPAGEPREVGILEGFPARLEGRILFLPKDNMNTDGIYGKEFTYKDDLPPKEMGTKAFLNYDPEFQKIAKEGDLVVGGANFGSGSSREQAATALQFRGIRLVVAESYSQTYKRNAFNNGYPLVECPKLVAWLRERHAAEIAKPVLTIDTGLRAEVDFRRSRIVVEGREFPFLPLGEVAQGLIVAGGVENLVRKELGLG